MSAPAPQRRRGDLAAWPTKGDKGRSLGEVLCELLLRLLVRFGILHHAEKGGRVIGREDVLCPGLPNFDVAAVFRNAELGSEKRLSRGGAEADDDLRTDKCDLCLEPAVARVDLGHVWLGVK